MLYGSATAQIIDEKNATVQLTVTQEFFTNFTYEFLAPNLEMLPSFLANHDVFFDIMDENITVSDVNVRFNITDIRLEKIHLNGSVPIIDILDDKLSLNLNNFQIRIGADYMFISDPPILADIGTFWFQLSGVNFQTVVSTFLLDKHLQVDVKSVDLNFTNPESVVNIDGLSDLSLFMNDTVNIVSTIVRNRVASLLNTPMVIHKINLVVNAILLEIPLNIHLGGDLYLEGLLYENPTFVQGSYLTAKVDTTLVNTAAPYERSNIDTLPAANTSMTYAAEF